MIKSLDFSSLNLSHNKKILSKFGNPPDSSKFEFKSAFDLLKEELLSGCILSYNEKLDEILKNVIVPRKIIEFTGHFDSTTPICLKLSVSVQLPKSCGGCGGEAFYISTNGNFSIEKLRDIAFEFVEEFSRDTEVFNVEYILSHIFYTKVNNPVEFLACIFELELFLMQKQVRLLVIDSISYILRQMEIPERFNTINKIFQLLRYLSDKYNLVVLITNFCTTRINQDEAYTVASFGDSFYHFVNSRVSFSKKANTFYGKLMKSVVSDVREVDFNL
ncbi:unnamed protein product [Psylliodes chrysocephalus]|uniref:DNA repair protein RAD51 homolog 3 n=1 Tax=Psylliodes chrysocephalus TaxID=3402493 RepID=A0A9P0CM00_9CUCU|nr:unnamed protein product [Psylliodes chrysocephala]